MPLPGEGVHIAPKPRKTGTFWRAPRFFSLGRGRRLAAKNPLPERTVSLGRLFAPLVGQQFYRAGLVLEQFQEPNPLFLPVLGEPVAVFTNLHAVGFEVRDAAVFFRDQIL